ncbi:putative gp57 [Burkholderia pseudomallei TSV28]|nr:putative gp57 [Burkholderia pseudomallei MSHR7334]KGX68614.1 putative gp57 [Burkholderia pseudomallei TSV28]
MSERPTLHVVSLSGGKDSTATLCVALEQHGSENVRAVMADSPVSFFHQGTTGHTGQASTIWKVVDWSKTSCGGRQYDLLADAEPATACSSAYGLCE